MGRNILPYATTKNPVSKKQFLQTIGFQMNCGVPIIRAIESSGKDFPVYQRDAEEIKRNISEGRPFCDYFLTSERLGEFWGMLDKKELIEKMKDYEQNGELSEALYHCWGSLTGVALRLRVGMRKRDRDEIGERDLKEAYGQQEMVKRLNEVETALVKSRGFSNLNVENFFEQRKTCYFDSEVLPDFYRWKCLFEC